MVRVYAFYISEKDKDGNKWAPASFADADAGIIRHVDTGQERSWGLMGVQGEEDDHIRLTLTNSPVVLVAVYNVNDDRFYAYRTFEYKPPLREQVRMIFRFQLWRTETTYTEIPWTFVNGNKEQEQPVEP
jgi:hypothetical protein